MKCKIIKTASLDLIVWVRKAVFMDNVDVNDLACRESKIIHDWYHPEWFSQDNNDSKPCFTPPAFEFRNGKLQGINGRHRAILLYRHMDIIPMLLVQPSSWPRNKLDEIIDSEIKEYETIELPDLPINEDLREPPQNYDVSSLPTIECPWLETMSEDNNKNKS
jgi:hypothetical protein